LRNKKNENWDNKNYYSDGLIDKNVEELLNVKLRYTDYCPYLGKNMITISDKWESVNLQAQDNMIEILKNGLQGDKSLISYAVYRIGLKRVFWQEVDCFEFLDNM